MPPAPAPLGTLDWRPLADHLDLVAGPVAAAAGLVPDALVAPIDATLADTAAFCAAYQVPAEASANCVVVEGRRAERVVRAAVMVLAVDRADVNKVVRKHLDVRKLSFMGSEAAQEATGMIQGGITPVGLPSDWLILVDSAVVAAGPVVIGGGVRGAKLLLHGGDLAALPGAAVLDLAVPR
ncbi:MAG TPA: YbaK/EbsC family protein [Dermatophilaceae bacterium]|nr:YbaK/EbsC family protein [Dermatophilaceae bacterium]